MSFSRANSGGWAFNDELTSAQINTIDINQSRGIDGNAGGTYTPSAKIIIAGANGLKVTGLFETTSVAALSNGFISNGSSQFNANTSITTGNTFSFDNGSTLSANGIVSYGSSAAVTHTVGGTWINNVAAPFFNSKVILASGADVSSGATMTLVASSTLAVPNTSSIAFSSGSSMTGSTSLATVCTASGSGRVVRRRVSVSDADHLSYTIADGDLFHCTATLTANRNLQFLNTGAIAGDTIDISIVGSGGTANTVTIKDNGGGTITTMRNVTDSGGGIPGLQRVTIVYTGAAWVMFDYSSRTN